MRLSNPPTWSPLGSLDFCSTSEFCEVEHLEGSGSGYTKVPLLLSLLCPILPQVIQDDDASHWIDCSEVPCNTIHVTLSWFSLIGCAHAVMYTTCAIVWLSVTPQEATRDFLYWTPSIMQRPSQSMMLGVVCWSFDALWLTIIKHGSSLMIWLAVPAFGLLFHVAWTFVRMRFFCWNWPKEPCGYYQTAWKMQGVKQPAGAEAAYQPINTGDALGGSGGPATR